MMSKPFLVIIKLGCFADINLFRCCFKFDFFCEGKGKKDIFVKKKNGVDIFCPKFFLCRKQFLYEKSVVKKSFKAKKKVGS